MQNKTNKKEVNVAQRYFTQKKITVPEIIALTALGISLILFFIGKDEVFNASIALVPASIIALVVIKSNRVKDRDYDELLDKIISENDISPNASGTFKGYNFKKGRRLLGKDNKLRGEIYCISRFSLGNESCDIEVSEINIPDSTIHNKTYTLPFGTDIEITEDNIETPKAVRKATYLSFSTETGTVDIPFDDRSYDSSIIIGKLTENNKGQP